jgi:DNA-binding MarR family transcriptional regulator
VATEDTADRAARLIHALDRRDLAAHRQRSAMSRELDVRDEELLVLRHLAEHGSTTQAELAALTGLSRSGIGALIQRLERMALIERRPHPSDRRVRHVELTARTRQRMTATSAELRHAVAQLLDGLSPAEQATIERFLAGVAALSEHESLLPPATGDAPVAPAPSPWALWG